MSFNKSIGELTPHPLNKDIYGDENVQELADSIRKNGLVNPLIVNQDNVIISGHRRYYACLSLGMKEVPCEILAFDDENEELERLLLENQYREKSVFQKAKEAERWEVIEKVKARQRQGTRTDLIDNIVDTGPPSDSRKTRDIIAEKVGLGSGKTYERAKPAVKKIDELKEHGNTKDAEFLTAVLNDNVSAAKDLSTLVSLDVISSELKDQVINKEIPVKKAVQAIKIDLAALAEDTKVTDTVADTLTELVDTENTVLPSENLQTPIEELKTDEKTDTCDTDSIIIEFEGKVDQFVKTMDNYVDRLKSLTDENSDKVLNSIGKAQKILNKIKSEMF